MSLRRSLALWAPALVYAAALFVASSRSELPSIVALVWDKLLHAGAWTGLTLLLLRATHRGRGPLRPLPTLAAAAIAIAYGMSDEYHQSFVRGRDPELDDLAADSVGAPAAIVMALGWQGLRRLRSGRVPPA